MRDRERKTERGRGNVRVCEREIGKKERLTEEERGFTTLLAVCSPSNRRKTQEAAGSGHAYIVVP